MMKPAVRLLLLASSCTLPGSAHALQAVGDSCASPVLVSGTGMFTFDSTGATSSVESGGGCDTASIWMEDMWEVWTAPQTGFVTFSLCGTVSFDARIAAYQGNACPTQAPIACSMDACGLDPSITFPALEGSTYLLRIGSHYAGGSGAGSFSLTLAPGLWDRSISAPQITPSAVPGTYDVVVPLSLHVTGPVPPGSGVGASISLMTAGGPVGGTGTGGYGGGGAIATGPGNWCPSPGTTCSTTACSIVPGITRYCEFYAYGELHPGSYSLVSACSCGQDPFFGDNAFWAAVQLPANTPIWAELQPLAGALPEYLTGNDISSSTSAPIVGVTFCSGDGTGSPCPCGNNGAAGLGCANSLNPSGAELAAWGATSLSADTVTLYGSGMPNSSALFFQGTTQLAGSPFGDGLRCAGGSILRLATRINAAGASQYPNLGDLPVSVRGLITAPGTRAYQVWYRNAGSFCTSATFNLSNGFAIAWAP